MPLTPEDVHSKQFTTVRMKTGYDMDEVDSFLDEIEVELARLVAENDDLRARLSRAQATALDAERRATAAGAAQSDALTAVVVQADDTSPSLPIVAEVVTESVVEVVEVETVAPAAAAVSAEQASAQALSILEMAQRTADQTLTQAQEEAGRIVEQATLDAATTATERRAEVVQLERRIGDLKTLEQGYRSQLRAFITGQLENLNTHPEIVTDVPASSPAVIREEPGDLGGESQLPLEADRVPGWDS